MEKKDLKNSDLEKVSGGKKHYDSDVIEYSGTVLIYCKYCGKDTIQSLRKKCEIGYDHRSKSHTCDLYDCPECNNTNYYDHYDHQLI